MSNDLRMSETTLTHSASGNMGSYVPAMSKSCGKEFIEMVVISHRKYSIRSHIDLKYSLTRCRAAWLVHRCYYLHIDKIPDIDREPLMDYHADKP